MSHLISRFLAWLSSLCPQLLGGIISGFLASFLFWFFLRTGHKLEITSWLTEEPLSHVKDLYIQVVLSKSGFFFPQRREVYNLKVWPELYRKNGEGFKKMVGASSCVPIPIVNEGEYPFLKQGEPLKLPLLITKRTFWEQVSFQLDDVSPYKRMVDSLLTNGSAATPDEIITAYRDILSVYDLRCMVTFQDPVSGSIRFQKCDTVPMFVDIPKN